MFLKKKSNIMFRNYDSFGYLTDNRNFGYRAPNLHQNSIGDKILSESGNVFMCILGRQTQHIDDLAEKICTYYNDISNEEIKKDAEEFYGMLEVEGFIISGKTFQECEEKDINFSHKKTELNYRYNSSFFTTNKTLKNTRDFFQEQFQGKPHLINLHMEITSRCNERCIHCYIPDNSKNGEISLDTFYDILKQCSEMKLLHLTLSGGEPMLHKNFCDFLKKCREYELSVNVLSNLTLLNDDIIDEMKENPLLGVQVSLYSMDSSVHDKITQIEGSFKKTINSILKLIENNIPLQISCPILKQNKENYQEVIKWAKAKNINVGDDYTIIARYDHSTQNIENRLSIKEVEEIIRGIAVTDHNYVEKIKKDAEEKEANTVEDSVCSVCSSSICIKENGDVYPCAGWQGYVVGNIKEKRLIDIWKNSEKIKYLREIKNKNFLQCVECSEKKYCTVCMVRNANEDPNGDPLAINNYFCEIAKLNKKIVDEY